MAYSCQQYEQWAQCCTLVRSRGGQAWPNAAGAGVHVCQHVHLSAWSPVAKDTEMGTAATRLLATRFQAKVSARMRSQSLDEEASTAAVRLLMHAPSVLPSFH